MTNILWLASYPRSGNTWLRIFLTNCRQAGAPASINAMEPAAIASDRALLDRALGVETACLSDADLRDLLPSAYRRFARDCAPGFPVKVHDRYDFTRAGDPVFPGDASLGVIHIVRNPLDVAVSLAQFAQRPLDQVIARMADTGEIQTRGKGGLRRQVPQHLDSWSGHARSWMEQSAIRTLRVRYEDMALRPHAAFPAIAEFAGLAHGPDHIDRAVAASRFDGLQAQERGGGFIERPPRTPVFFRQGRAGAWRSVLTEAQVRRLISDHGEVMQKLGYLAASGEITDTGTGGTSA